MSEIEKPDHPLMDTFEMMGHTLGTTIRTRIILEARGLPEEEVRHLKDTQEKIEGQMRRVAHIIIKDLDNE